MLWIIGKISTALRLIKVEKAEEDIKKLAEEKAKEKAKHEAWIRHFQVFLPLLLLAVVVSFATPLGLPYDIFRLFLYVAALIGGFAVYFSVKESAYKNYYEIYLKEFQREGEKSVE